MRENHAVSQGVHLPQLPVPSETRLAVRLTPDALRQVRGGHPWVYADAITSVSDGSAPAGTLAVIFDAKRNFAAIGLWDPRSPIRVRVLHRGKPQQIDAAFWNTAVAAAYDRRASLESQGTTGWRWINGENDGFSGLIVDRYDTTLVVKVYTPAWLPHLEVIVNALIEVDHPERIVVRLGRNAQSGGSFTDVGLEDGTVIYGPPADRPVEFLENHLRFGANVISGQKTGHFLDQRDNRAFIASVSQGQDVLDVFCCTGGFTVHAAAAGAKSVHSIDLAAPAIEETVRNMKRNNLGDVANRQSVGDAFEVLEKLGTSGESYDVVIIDPPSFASKASERDRAMRAYRKLCELGLGVLRPNGRLFQASCSSRVTEDDLVSTVRATVSASGRRLEHIDVFGHGLDHPVTFPQGTYLSAITGVVR